ncbi:hypothetical protein HanRHA438_Chr14g0653041 [Helianthus annuus]|nr:hypothetical protein HanRHA438_Chr14g0653041 [Helianthus annuus]
MLIHYCMLCRSLGTAWELAAFGVIVVFNSCLGFLRLASAVGLNYVLDIYTLITNRVDCDVF